KRTHYRLSYGFCWVGSFYKRQVVYQWVVIFLNSDLSFEVSGFFGCKSKMFLNFRMCPGELIGRWRDYL
ncbi:hypothetical protein, partial [Pseudomonas lactis]|uniref:hypothetical protein n=1 Tax=Pseudomonas lactis TaxID=1615674 RepID=UPI001F1A9823